MDSSPNIFKAADSSTIFFNPSGYVGTLEDIEQPAWISTTSFSESCGSCLSRMSSLCLDGKIRDSPQEGRLFPDHLENSDVIEEIPSQVIPQSDDQYISDQLVDGYHEDGFPFTVSGSLQSLSSSSKTVYASPRSNSEDQFYCPLNKSVLSDKAMQRRGSLYRERAPSENALDFNNLWSIRESKLSHSLHDVSSIPSNGLKNPPRRCRNVGSSLSALCTRNRSRDSGFVHGESSLSLSSAGRNYDHVESKVKQYIQNIKDADAARRKERSKSISKSSVASCPKQEGNYFELMDLVQKMQFDMEEKDRHLMKLQEDYNCLLSKYAEAENRIDKLRFGWHGNITSSNVGSNTQGQRIGLSQRILSQFKQPTTLPDIDDSSLTSSMFLSNFESVGSPDSSYNYKDDGVVHNNKGALKKEVVVSAPLRPISSLYCTSVRLDKVLPPLNLSTPVGGPSTTSSQGQSPSSNYSKKARKQVLDVTIQAGTTDTGIGSYCHDEMSATPLPRKAEPIGHLPHEDPILKVQRWQKSLNTPIHSESTHQKQCQTSNVKVYSSIGVQVNLGNGAEFPSISSGMSTPMVPCLNLGELSSCTEEFSDSLLSSDCGKKCMSQPSTGPSMNSTGIPDSNFSVPPKDLSFSGSSSKRACMCSSCMCRTKSKKIVGNGEERREKFLPKEKSLISLPEKKKEAKKAISQFSGLELAELLSLVLKDQDHVVPNSPEEEKSFQPTFKTLRKKINSLKSSVNLQTFVSLLDMLVERVPSEECSCRSKQIGQSSSLKSDSHPKSESSEHYEGDYSLLQCLEEMDDYTNQVWAKTESFLEVLNSNKCGSAFKSE